jgi:chorismate synthase
MNSIGRLFRLTIFGESHGPAVGVVIDGCPPGLPINNADFEAELSRRRSGAPGTTARQESDQPHFLSGVLNDHTTGAPLTIVFENSAQRSADYTEKPTVYRPGHADFTANRKFQGRNDPRGGGHFSGRLTVGLVAAGVLAKKIIAPVQVSARLIEVGGQSDYTTLLEQARREGDSLGGIIECQATDLPIGLGEPFFDSVESLLSHAMFAIPGIKGVEFGAGFAAAKMRGSEYNDRFINTEGKTATNNSGGVNGGLTNGNELVFRIAVRPTASIAHVQQTLDFASGEMTELSISGRHDVCFALRAPVIVEALAACCLADFILIHKSTLSDKESRP